MTLKTFKFITSRGGIGEIQAATMEMQNGAAVFKNVEGEVEHVLKDFLDIHLFEEKGVLNVLNVTERGPDLAVLNTQGQPASVPSGCSCTEAAPQQAS